MNLFEINNFTFTYPEEEMPALKNLSFAIKEGEVTLFCGPSGCGKSTLFQHFKSVLTPHGKCSGEILYCGQPLNEVLLRQQSEEIGFVFQDPENQIVTDKVWHELAFGLESLAYSQQEIRIRVAENASYFGIEDWFERPVSELSGGQKQLLNLASVMSMQPKVLILDEPTSQLDPIAANEFIETLFRLNREMGMTIILCEHRAEAIIPYANRIFFMKEGEVVAETSPKEMGDIIRKVPLMEKILPAPMALYKRMGGIKTCPMTVGEGRVYVKHLVKNKALKKIPNDTKVEDKKCEKVLSAKHLSFRYEKKGKDVVKDCSLDLYQGELFAIVGGNGSGKSTTLSLLAGIEKPYEGKISLFGKKLAKYSQKELYNGMIGLLPQNTKCLFVETTVEDELLEMVKHTKEDRKRVEEMIERMNLQSLRRRHPYDLSGGERQRLALGKVLLLNPKILYLDEPTKGVDPEGKEKLGKLFRELLEQGMSILMVSHDIEFCGAVADRVGLFFRGQIVSKGDTREFFAGNQFYTTAANRMARDYFKEVLTVEEIEKCINNLED